MVATTYGLVAAMDPARGEVIRQILSGQGLDTYVTRDGREASAALRGRGTPGLVVTELSLPRSDGFTLLRQLRSLADEHEVPAIVMSAFADLRAAAEGMRRELGIAAVLPSRASAEKWQRAVKRALDRDPITAGLLPDEASAEPVFSLIGPSASPLATLRWRGNDEAIGAIVGDAARRLDVPVAFVALALGDRIAVPARVGVTDTPEARMLLEQVAAARDLLVVPDASAHPLLEQARRHAGYAAAPIVSARGEVVGVLCVADERPLALGPAELDELALFARRVAGELELRMEKSGAERSQALDVERSPLTDHLEIGVALVDGQQRLRYGNAALAAMCEVPVLRLTGMGRDAFIDALAQLAGDPTEARRRLRVAPGHYAAREEIELARPRRRVLRWTAKPVRLPGEIASLEVFQDITAEVDLARERELLARTDWLTGLVNRRGGAEAIGREVARARRMGSSLCFALFDIDEFKQVNDAHGHQVGDEVLREVARVMLSGLRGSDLAVRWGGDELLVALPSIPEAGARVFAERVRKRVAAIDVRGLPRVTVSCGVAELAKLEDVSAVIKRADTRLYEAKAAGRNRVK